MLLVEVVVASRVVEVFICISFWLTGRFMPIGSTPADARPAGSLQSYDRVMSADFLPSSEKLAALLVDNHRQFLAFIQRRVGSRELAEDILQDAFVKSIEKAEDLRDETSSVAWFYRMLRNAVIDHYRRTSVRGKALESFGRELEGAVEPPPEIRDEICACVSRLAASLKPEYADAIQRLEIEGVSMQQYATAAGISPNNAAVRAFRAREALRKQVKTSCGTCAEHGCVECTCRPAQHPL
jgi:RNA polymerase sigma factor (sigma-70 family)